MRIPIPEIEERFGKDATSYDSFDYIMLFLEKFCEISNEQYILNDISDVDATEASLIVRIVNSLRTLRKICGEAEDYCAACTICRYLGDSIAAFNLVYANPDKEERIYRHYLYILDGLYEKANLQKDDIIDDGRLPKDIFLQLKKQVEDNRENVKRGITFCEQELNDHPYANRYPEFHKAALKDKAWQYSNLTVSSKGNVPKHQWKKLYESIDDRESIQSMYSSYFSQFVHGLYLSNQQGLNCEENFESIISFALCLSKYLFDEIRKRYCTGDNAFTHGIAELIINVLRPD